jgi:hypothetical protein
MKRIRTPRADGKDTLHDVLEPIPDYGDLIAFEDFLACVERGTILDCDGSGYWSLETKYYVNEDIACIPKWLRENRPEGVTHVLWFNK